MTCKKTRAWLECNKEKIERVYIERTFFILTHVKIDQKTYIEPIRDEDKHKFGGKNS